MLLVVLWIAAFVLMVLGITLALGAAMQGRKFARRFERSDREGFVVYQPRAAVIVPFKGLEPGLEAHLDRLCSQAYDDYVLVLVVESRDDPVYAVLQAQRDRFPDRITVLVAGIAPPTRGQKVHNQLAGIAHLQAVDGGETVWAFADSDAAPSDDWLGRLVGPLVQPQTGATTGYRWLVPDDKAGAVTGWTHLASVMNSSVMGFAGTGLFRYAWGGSMALRVETAATGRLVDYLDGALSDDYQLTAMCRDLGLRIYFVHQCVVASPIALTLGELVGFVRRQYLITRTHSLGIYVAGLTTLGLWTLAMVSTWAALILGLWWEPGRPGWMIAAATLVIVAILHQVRAHYRQQAMAHALGADAPKRYAATLRVDRWLTPWWMVVHLLLMASALVGRTIHWRGRAYRIDAPTRVRQVGAVED